MAHSKQEFIQQLPLSAIRYMPNELARPLLATSLGLCGLVAPIVQAQPSIPPSPRPVSFPHRIWAACDFEGQTPDYGWFGRKETNQLPRYPGNRTALAAEPGPYRNFSAVMAGVFEALVATAIGLFVAIPAVMAFNYFQRKARSMSARADILAHLLLSELAIRSSKTPQKQSQTESGTGSV